jgi:hypothetical protein
MVPGFSLWIHQVDTGLNAFIRYINFHIVYPDHAWNWILLYEKK